MIYCPDCGTANRDGSRYCNQCGQRISDATPVACPRCGCSNLPDSEHCQECGLDLSLLRSDAAPAPVAYVARGEADDQSGGLPPWLDTLESPTDERERDDGDLDLEDEPTARRVRADWTADAIPIEPVVGVPYKARERAEVPPTTEQQHAAELFAAVASEEVHAAPQVVPGRSRPRPFSMRWRALVFLALLIAVLLPLLWPEGPYAHLPAVPVAVAGAVRTVGALPPGSPVLVVLDYDAGHAGELDPITDLFLQQLVSQGAQVLAVSTRPEGGTLASLAWQRIAGRLSAAPATALLNLGYVAGGEAAIRALAGDIPTAAPVLYGSNTATPEELGGAKDLPLIVVIGSDVTAIRRWIEQVWAPFGTPLVVGVPALAAPAVAPYQASGQLRGAVAGIEGAAAYERLNAQQGTGSSLTMAVRFGAWVSAALVVLANLWALGERWRRGH